MPNGGAIEQGNYTAATSGWQQNATGADLLFIYDQDGATGAGVDYQAVVFKGSGSTSIGASSFAFDAGTASVLLTAA